MRANFLHELMPANDLLRVEPGTDSIEIVGYFSLIAGVGESARLCAETLAEAGNWKVSCVDVGGSVSKKKENAWLPPASEKIDESFPKVRMLHLNPPMMPPAIFKLGLTNYRKTFNIGYWAWELENLPQEWIKAIRYVNAIFVPSSFTKKTIEAYTSKPIFVVPHPIRIEPAEKNLRTKLNVPENAFLVSTIFSYGSSFGRKNPIAVVKSFRKAFEENPNAYLVIKTSHADKHTRELESIKNSIGESERIILIDEIWPSERVSALIEASDAYISLHRSEGFGLTIAEAILRSVPVVVTAWSGNMDFCRHDGCYLVDVNLIAVEDSYPEFSNLRETRWADPDVNCAAAQLQKIHDDRTEASKRAATAQGFLKNYLINNSYEKFLGKLSEKVF